MAKLPCGVAAVYRNEWVQPVLCKVERCEADLTERVFGHDDNSALMKKNGEISDSRLKCIMDNELFQKGDKEDLRELKSLIIRSKRDSFAKVEFLAYVKAEKEAWLEKLRCLLYDFLTQRKRFKLRNNAEKFII